MNPILTYTIDETDRVISTNSEWDSFAKQSDAADLEYSVHGKSIWSFIGAEKLKNLYFQLFEGVRATQKAVDINFRCDNAQVMKFMNMSIEPEPNNYLKISTCLLREISRKKALAREVFYLGLKNGTPMCSNCNRVYPHETVGWIEVDKALSSKLISEKLNVTFEICESCIEYFDKTINKLKKGD
ncbi:MAG: hypothetical protein P1U56_00410 [Saprospiraceae bacterium]|nr:hypothetical protein [Saprospiraceae bacterium]